MQAPAGLHDDMVRREHTDRIHPDLRPLFCVGLPSICGEMHPARRFHDLHLNAADGGVVLPLGPRDW